LSVNDDHLTLCLTGQAMIRADLRTEAPDTLPAIDSLVTGDAAFTNFEAAVFDPGKGETIRSGRFASPHGAMETLQNVGFSLLSLANNHSFDVGHSGILNTVDAADKLNLTHAGTGRDLADASAFRVLDTPKGRIAFLAVASGLVLDGRATKSRPGVNELRMSGPTPYPEDVERILAAVAAAREAADVVVVSHHNHHYPGVERPTDFKQLLLSELPDRLAPPEWLQEWGRRLVDTGADVVAGHGPPFLHGAEIHRGKPIFYSLGNFIFQVPPESVHLEEPIMWESVVAYVDLVDCRVERVRVQPIGMNKVGRGLPNPHDEFDVNEYHRTRGLPRPVGGTQAAHLLARFAGQSSTFGTTVTVTGDTAELDLPQDA
jgi:poly-gamma-glutamate capsule biosynthesis protein CapA/YwtB (metallophosphatase superfamily)